MNRLITLKGGPAGGEQYWTDVPSGDFFEVAIRGPLNPPSGQETIEACFSLIAKYRIERHIGYYVENP